MSCDSPNEINMLLTFGCNNRMLVRPKRPRAIAPTYGWVNDSLSITEGEAKGIRGNTTSIRNRDGRMIMPKAPNFGLRIMVLNLHRAPVKIHGG